MVMKAERLQQHNRQGLIPGPDENEETFQERIDYCLALKETMPSEATSYLDEALAITTPLYDLAPEWVPIMFSNQKLAPWHGGCAWIFQMKEEAPLGAYFQLRSALKNRTRYLGMYDRKELLAHELCHVGRMAFEEPRFEEFFAYRTSTGWRAWLGPIVQSSTESMLFVISLVLVFFAQLFALFVDATASKLALWASLLPLGMVAFALIRLCWRHHQLNRCIKILTSIAGNHAEAIAYRMTDNEIINCASYEQLIKYASEQNSPRWDYIKEFYFRGT